MKISQRQVVEQNYSPTTTKAPPTHKVDVVKPKYKATVDPQLANFDVRLRKKRKLFAKAQSILDKIHETADPNVAAFLRLALERLNAEEGLMAQTTQVTHRNSKKVNAQAYKKHAAKIPTTTLPLPLPEPTPPHTYRIPSVVPHVTMQPPTTQPSTVITTASTAVPTTLFYYEEPITETIPASNWQWGYMENMTPMEQPLNGKNNRRKPIRRLRQKWLNKVSLTTPSPTIPTPPWSNVEPVKPDNIMISSIVDQVANSLMGKVTGEIHSLKQSIKSMQSKIAQNKPNDNPRQNTLISSNNESKPPAPNIKNDVDRSLVNKISSNVLTKLSGVSWLGKTHEVPQADQVFKQSQSSTTTIEPKSTSTHIYTTRPTQPTTDTPTTRKPSKPKILGSWMSGLPPAVSMQLFAERTVKKDSSNPPKANLNISPKSKESSSGKSRRISTRNNPFNVPKTFKKTNNENRIVTESYIVNQVETSTTTSKSPAAAKPKPKQQPPTRKHAASVRKMTPLNHTDIVNRISDAVIKQLNGGQVNKEIHRTTIPSPTTIEPQDKPEPTPANAKGTKSNSNGAKRSGKGGDTSLADTIASKVFGKINLTLDALYKSASTQEKNTAPPPPELDELLPMLYWGRGQQMARHRQMMQMQNMPPGGMMPAPFPTQNSQGTQGNTQPNKTVTPTAQSPNKEPSQMSLKVPGESVGPWTPYVHQWMGGGMPYPGNSYSGDAWWS